MNKKTKRLTAAAIATAIIFIVTRIFVPIPGGHGYVHLGDTFIYLFACLLPMPYGIFAGAIGASLSDLTSAYAVYTGPTFIIKAGMAAMFTSRKNVFSIRNIAAVIPATIILTGGYFLTETILYDSTVAIGNILYSFLQAGASAALFIVLAIILSKVKAYTSLKEGLLYDQTDYS